ncbi:MAG TPA: SsrA-binding protein SmpB [Candidatus Woesebacteria bacterium]|nr:SsrA-binding protein SmpB [Candidatus Woesebacteria bacterium]
MLSENKKARFDYEIVEDFESGIVLSGSEVKSVRGGGASMAGARVIFEGDEAYVIGLNIPKYRFDSREDYEPGKRRKLLLHREETVEIQTKMKSAGLTVVPIEMYNKGSLVKVKIALVRGKKKFEKREIIKKRESQLELARRLKVAN